MSFSSQLPFPSSEVLLWFIEVSVGYLRAPLPRAPPLVSEGRLYPLSLSLRWAVLGCLGTTCEIVYYLAEMRCDQGAVTLKCKKQLSRLLSPSACHALRFQSVLTGVKLHHSPLSPGYELSAHSQRLSLGPEDWWPQL